MSKGPPVDYVEARRKSLYAAARMFLEKGYTQSPLRAIAREAGISLAALLRVFGSKEGLLCALVDYVLEGQLSAAGRLVDGVTEDPVLYYAAETTLQLYMAESDAAIRDLYSAVYSLPESLERVRRSVVDRLLTRAFGAYQPGATREDFYQLEIASGGIIRGYMTAPSTPDFPPEQKARRFLECSLRVYQVPEPKIAEAIRFVSRIDYPTIARETIASMFARLSGEHIFALEQRLTNTEPGQGKRSVH